MKKYKIDLYFGGHNQFIIEAKNKAEATKKASQLYGTVKADNDSCEIDIELIKEKKGKENENNS